MKIKEVEELSGMTRANIRFYEKEGLLSPQRKSNGYRDYTEEDVETLKRIRLLRSIHISLEDIKELNENVFELTELLPAHLIKLKEKNQDLEQSRFICEQLCGAQASYRSFDAQHYLDMLNHSLSEVPPELKEDSVPKVTAPWRRYFARMIDESIYALLWDAVLACFFHINIMEMSWLGWVVELIMTACILLLIEPTLLSCFGITPGKILFGLRVSAESGARLTWREAFQRTWLVLGKGSGFHIPVYRLIREYKSYRDCRAGENMEWEEENVLWLNRRYAPAKAVGAVFLMMLLTGATFYIWQAGAIPKNRGNISAAQYAENFNEMQTFYQTDRQLNLPEFYLTPDGDSSLRLTDSGTWEKRNGGTYIVDTANAYAALPQLHFEEMDGVLTGVSFSAEYKNENIEIASYGDLMALTALSFICAQDSYNLTAAPPSLLYRRIKESADTFQDFTFSEAGITVEAAFQCCGYEFRQAQYSSSEVLVPVYGEEPYFQVEYRVYKSGDKIAINNEF